MNMNPIATAGNYTSAQSIPKQEETRSHEVKETRSQEARENITSPSSENIVLPTVNAYGQQMLPGSSAIQN